MSSDKAEKNSRNLRKTYSTISAGLLVFTLILIFTQTALQLVSENSNVVNADWYILFLTDVPLYGVSLWSLLFFMSKIKGEKLKKQKFGIGSSVSAFFVACFFMIAGSIVGNFADQFMQGVFNVKTDNALNEASEAMNIYLEILFFVIIAPIGEELIFRKLILDRTSRYGEKAAIFFSAVSFALFHGNFGQLFYAFGAGLLLAYVYVKTGSYIRCVLLHAVVNAIFGVFAPHLYDYFWNKNPLISYAVVGGEYLLAIIGMIVFILYLSLGKVKTEKSKYSLSETAVSCAYSGIFFKLFFALMVLFMLSAYMG